jgi:hypothetical protein
MSRTNDAGNGKRNAARIALSFQAFSSGRRPVILDRKRRIAYLDLIHRGLGRLSACVALGLRPSALRHTLKRCPGFRESVEQVEQMRVEHLHALLYAAALGGDNRAAIFLLERHDRDARERGVGSPEPE